jgi:hypothetical protein
MDGIPSYARGGAFGFPGPTTAMAGHGPNRIVWTAPAEMDLGGVELSGLFTQAPFEPARQMQLRVYKNDSYSELLVVNADFNVQNTIVPLPVTRVAMEAGDTLTIEIDGGGPQGNGVSTFAAWNVIIQEIQLEGDYNRDTVVGAEDYVLWRKQVGATGTPGTVRGDGTTSGGFSGIPDGVVDVWDYLFWKINVGKALDPGVAASGYHPAAIIVQPTGVTLPDGSSLDISGSQTQGLQEAFDYSAAQGWDVFVLPGTYTLNAPLDIEELQLRTFRFEDVTFNFTSNVTNFGIRFDSTMQVDWYWKGGALNAPSATHGILFQPRTPHPKDGPIYGTVGVVDSRFDFQAVISAAAHRVTMNSTQAVINDTTFSFQGLSRANIHFVGSGFTETNFFSVGRTDDPIPFDLFSPAGRVTVLPPKNQFGIPGPGSFATVVKPDGTLLPTTGSSTSGLQEAINYAAANNLDLVVFGRGVRNVNPNTSYGHYTLNSTLSVPNLLESTWKIYSVTFLYPATGGTVFELAGLVGADFELTGEVVGPNADVVVKIKPETMEISDSIIRIQHPVATPNVDVNVLLDSSLQTIRNSEFYFHEVNQGQFGIRIDNPTSHTFFRENFLRTLHAHETNIVAVQLGQNESNASNIRSNHLELRTAAATYPSLIAVQVWGDYNFIDLIAVGTNQTFGVKFEPGSNNNTLYYGTISATTPIVDHGTQNTYIPHGSGSGSGQVASNAVVVYGPTENTTSSRFSAQSMLPRGSKVRNSLAPRYGHSAPSLLLMVARDRIDQIRWSVEAAIDATMDEWQKLENLSLRFNLAHLKMDAINHVQDFPAR